VSHLPERPLGHRLRAVDGLEGQHLLLEVGSQHEQVKELRDPGAREPQLARQGGLVGHEPALDGGLQVVREGELPGDLGGASLTAELAPAPSLASP
jgi:hypothetical protein